MSIKHQDDDIELQLLNSKNPEHDHNNCKHQHHDHQKGMNKTDSHGHGHGHGNEHGHSHNGRRCEHGNLLSEDGGTSATRRTNLIFYRFRRPLRAYLMTLSPNIWSMTVFWLCDSIKDNPFEYWGFIIFFTFIAIIIPISYWRTTMCNSAMIKKNIPAYYLNPGFAELCKKCPSWKPERSHHCSTCNRCVAKMDHHCPWAANCVGYKNHKTFFWFCFYTWIGAVAYMWRTVHYIWWGYSNGQLFEHSIVFYLWWLAYWLIGFLASFWLLYLSIGHFFYALNNLTTLDTLKGFPFKFPCVTDEYYHNVIGLPRNQYDQGSLANLSSFFHDSIYLWWYPDIRSPIDDGTTFLKNPIPKPAEIAEKFPNSKAALICAPKPLKLADFNYTQIFSRSDMYTSRKDLKIYSQVYKGGQIATVGAAAGIGIPAGAGAGAGGVNPNGSIVNPNTTSNPNTAVNPNMNS